MATSPHPDGFPDRLVAEEREPSLQFWNKVAWCRNTERAGPYEQNMCCVYYAPLCVDIAAFNYWKNVTLNTFTAYVLSV